ncbi:MAG: hypothetical protein E6051_20160 [Citrobacter freundii]|uniref:hypothetical protein n=1 Tax=Citrobacter freundii TaxID=546 RepID=UPI00290D0494|nr:hypothetical protein [Citrobacter freundii]
MSTTDFLKTLDRVQLQFCRNKCDEMLRAIQEEQKKVAWAVTDGSVNYGWYRTEDYLKAVECLVREAEKRWNEETEEDKGNPQTRGWLNFSIQGQRLPASEYEALFADGQWGLT